MTEGVRATPRLSPHAAAAATAPVAAPKPSDDGEPKLTLAS